MYPEVNLGPLHKLEPLIAKIYELRKTSYLYKRTEFGRLASFLRLADPMEGSSTKTYRQNQELKSHLPLQFFENM